MSDAEIQEEREFKEFQIQEMSLPRKEKRRLLRLLKERNTAFASGPYDLGDCNLVVHRIDTGNHDPIYTRPRKVSQNDRDGLRKELDDLEQLGIIQRSHTAWASAIVLVPKKDGTKRLCIDYRPLNAIVPRSSFPLPKISDIFAVLKGKRFFTCLDLAKGFWQIRIADGDRQKTAFTTPFGLYEFTRLPFGLNSAPGVFQATMTRVLSDLLWTICVVYIDDILIYSDTWEEHLEAIDKVLQRLIQANLKIKLSKCEFARTQLQYLGHIINSQGIATDPKKVEAIRLWAPPKTVKELEQFLGTVNYYAKFIPNFSHLASPLFQLKKKGVKWEFTEERLQAFNQLKEALCSAPVLRHPDFTKEFILTTDASGYGLGATLSQIGEDGEEHPISYASRTLKEEEMRYPPIDREALGVLWAVIHYEEYLEGNHFTIYTDHKPLVTLMIKAEPAKRLAHYAMQLEHFTFTIKYKPGVTNIDADALSRLERYPVKPLKTKRHKVAQTNESCSNDYDPQAKLANNTRLTRVNPVRQRWIASRPSCAPQSNEMEPGEVNSEPLPSDPMGKDGPPDLPSGTVVSESAIPPENQSAAPCKGITRDVASLTIQARPLITTLQTPRGQVSMDRERRDRQHMMQYLRQDNYFGPVVQTLESPRQEVPKVYTKIEHFQEVVPNFVLENGHLYRYIQGDVKLCIPQALVLNYLYQNHNTPGAAHGGITATSKRIARHYYWPTLLADVKRYVSRCELCQVYKDPSRQTRQPLGDLPMPQRPWHRVHMDVWSPGGESQDGNRYVVGFIDAYTKFAVLVPTSDHTAETISQVVMKNLVAVHGPPEVLVSDGAPEFVGTIQTELYKGLGVIRKVISPYHPQANGQIERLFRTIKPMLAIAARNHQHEWAEYVPLIAYAYNTAYHESIRNTPYFLLYGRDPAPGDTPSV